MNKFFNAVPSVFGFFCLLWIFLCVIFNIEIYFNVKNELKKTLSPSEYESLVTDGILSTSFRYISNGEEWQAFGVGDDVYTCRIGGDCG
jgi:hypothetical protein